MTSEFDQSVPFRRFSQQMAERMNDYNVQQQAIRIDGCVRELHSRIGARYVDCSLGNFECESSDIPSKKAKQKVIAQLRTFSSAIHDNIAKGTNIVFYGSIGTGKDHLLAAMLTGAARSGYPADWINGVDLFGKLRDLIDTKGEEGRESSLLRKLVSPQILGISDPIPPTSSNSKWIDDWMFRIIDARYRAKRSTWITINAATRKEMYSALSAPTCDRLLDQALLIECIWESHRKELKQ